MDIEEKTYIEIDDQYRSGVCLNEYNGEISVCSAHQDSDGMVYLDWIYPQTKDRKPSEKTLPWKITLGKPEKAAKHLRWLAGMTGALEDKPEKKESDNPAVEKNDVPF